MRIVRVDLHVPGQTAADVYRTLSDFSRYPVLSDSVRSVLVTEVSDDVTVSSWEVTFRAGVLRWTEEDRFDRDALTIAFTQIDGDIDLFDGSWAVTEAEGGTAITFAARLDMGIPSLADALEPIAARTLIDNTVSIVDGLMGGAQLVSSDVAVPVGSAA
ncbi:MAG: cyclase/dehydrase [Blastococcus sp.]|nr:cyclase/dehydrase [Blastococcus sp.]